MRKWIGHQVEGKWTPEIEAKWAAVLASRKPLPGGEIITAANYSEGEAEGFTFATNRRQVCRIAIETH